MLAVFISGPVPGIVYAALFRYVQILAFSEFSEEISPVVGYIVNFKFVYLRRMIEAFGYVVYLVFLYEIPQERMHLI